MAQSTLKTSSCYFIKSKIPFCLTNVLIWMNVLVIVSQLIMLIWWILFNGIILHKWLNQREVVNSSLSHIKKRTSIRFRVIFSFTELSQPDLHNPRHPEDYLQSTSWKMPSCRYIWAGKFSYILGYQAHFHIVTHSLPLCGWNNFKLFYWTLDLNRFSFFLHRIKCVVWFQSIIIFTK